MSKLWRFGFFTFGGLQFWCDRLVYHNWRIQENYWSKKCRLLDPHNIRRARGSYNDCFETLEKVKEIWELKRPSGHLVVLVHGLGRSCNMFNKMKKQLKNSGYNVVAISYPSTRYNLSEHVDNLENLLNNLDGIESISFVAHSLGNIIIRAAMAKRSKWRSNIKVKRFVQIAPPNNGSVLAEKVRNWGIVRAFYGDVLDDLIPEKVKELPTPDCEFGIIAGGNGTEKGMCPIFFKSDNDMIVKVEETRISGYSDFFVVDALHSFMPSYTNVIAATELFLSSGRFSKGKQIKKELNFL
ncbi:MAG: esterase/lipase family protein [Alphaproteobacteria bacterium]